MGNKPKCINPDCQDRPMTLSEAWEDFFEKILYPFRVGGFLDRAGNTIIDIGMGALQEYYQDQEKKKEKRCRICGAIENPAVGYEDVMVCRPCMDKLQAMRRRRLKRATSLRKQ